MNILTSIANIAIVILAIAATAIVAIPIAVANLFGAGIGSAQIDEKFQEIDF